MRTALFSASFFVKGKEGVVSETQRAHQPYTKLGPGRIYMPRQRCLSPHAGVDRHLLIYSIAVSDLLKRYAAAEAAVRVVQVEPGHALAVRDIELRAADIFKVAGFFTGLPVDVSRHM